MNRAELKIRAKEQLKGFWGIAIATILVSYIITDLDIVYKVGSRFGMGNLSYSLDFLSIFLGGVISTGVCKFLLNMATKMEEPRFENLFFIF